MKHTAGGDAKRARMEQLEMKIDDALSPAAFQRFLSTPNPLLHWRRPQDLLDTSSDFEHLLQFVESAKCGDMA